MKVEWTAGAKHDLKEIINYIALTNPQAAQRMNDRFHAAAALLRSSPYAGKLGALSSTREFISHPSYRMLYQIRGETVSILALVHTSRQWPPEPDGNA